jgi:hypothetical protein
MIQNVNNLLAPNPSRVSEKANYEGNDGDDDLNNKGTLNTR